MYWISWNMRFWNTTLPGVTATFLPSSNASDTVHFLSKYLRARREQGLSSEDAVRYAFHTVGIALLVTTLVLIAGFMVLHQSAFKLNSDMGLLTAITIGLALIADFIFLPPLLMKADRKVR